MLTKLDKKVKIKTFIDKIIIQPTGLCNLNCSYCYIPNRQVPSKISLKTVSNIRKFIKSCELKNSVEIIWHSGEPLIVGVSFFKKLLEEFKDLNVSHTIQTNLLLLNEAWCQLINEYKINITLSIDGVKSQNGFRNFWNNKNSFENFSKKVKLLKSHEIKFNAICVVHEKNIFEPKTLYGFFLNLGAKSVGFSIVELENNNTIHNNFNSKTVDKFWSELFNIWCKDKTLRIREFENAIQQLTLDRDYKKSPKYVDLNITFSCKGDLVILSPEFLDAKSSRFNNFILGNVNNSRFSELKQKINSNIYLDEFKTGIQNCFDECEYFAYCEGGSASNKYFENHDISSTRTIFCTQTKISLINSIINSI